MQKFVPLVPRYKNVSFRAGRESQVHQVYLKMVFKIENGGRKMYLIVMSAFFVSFELIVANAIMLSWHGVLVNISSAEDFDEVHLLI